MKHTQKIIEIIISTLQLNNSVGDFTKETQLIGGIPEFDSMAVLSILEAIENQFGITIDEDEISAELFETVGSFVNYIEGKLK